MKRTFAPRAANSKAMPAPIPLEAPVMIAVFPSRARFECSVCIMGFEGARQVEARDVRVKLRKSHVEAMNK
jgi:hypothetical protein